jgi:hypothetical protein
MLRRKWLDATLARVAYPTKYTTHLAELPNHLFPKKPHCGDLPTLFLLSNCLFRYLCKDAPLCLSRGSCHRSKSCRRGTWMLKHLKTSVIVIQRYIRSSQIVSQPSKILAIERPRDIKDNIGRCWTCGSTFLQVPNRIWPEDHMIEEEEGFNSRSIALC